LKQLKVIVSKFVQISQYDCTSLARSTNEIIAITVRNNAVIAYHQPVTRADIEQIRGVTNNSQILRTLFDWNWIKESGYRELPGRPALLVTFHRPLNALV
jgi:chromosome segregation and condensation protein ScpB